MELILDKAMQHFDFSDYSRLSNEVIPTKLATGIENDSNTNTIKYAHTTLSLQMILLTNEPVAYFC